MISATDENWTFLQPDHMYIQVSTSTVQLFVIYIQTLTNFLLLFEFAQIIMKSKKFLVAFSKVPQLLSQTFE